METEASMDRISELPKSTLHHILSFLSQKNAVQTCVLSKSWRYVGITRPNVEFLESCFAGNRETLISALGNTLQRYADQKLSVQEFILEITGVNDSRSISLLKKCITTAINQNMGLKTFGLSSTWNCSEKLDLPSIVFKSESLQELYLKRCNLNQVNNKNNSVDNVAVLLKHLQKLSLTRVCIPQETLEAIFSRCRLLEHVSIYRCEGFKTLRVNKPHVSRLKYFAIDDYDSRHQIEEEPISIEFDAPTFETIVISNCRFRHRDYFLPRLACLFLSIVRLSTESIKYFSGEYMPLLQHLTLDLCYGFQELHMYLSGSVTNLSIRNLKDELITATIDAPNISTFVYEGDVPQSVFSFATTSPEWKSKIILKSDECFDSDHRVSPWFHRLHELLNALSQSEVSLELSQCTPVSNDKLHPQTIEDVPLVVVESLSLTGYYTYFSILNFLNCLFCVCRPRNICRHLLSVNDDQYLEKEDKKLYRYLLEFFFMKREMRQYFWPQGLEEVSLERFDENGQKQRPFFQLKWKE